MEKQVERTFLEGSERQKLRAYSPAVITRGGKTVWLAGHGPGASLIEPPLAGDFVAQTHACFSRLKETLERAGGSLDDIVTMTVFITDARYGTPFTEIRQGYFPKGFPASALITVAGLAQPQMLVEIQGIAVIPDA